MNKTMLSETFGGAREPRRQEVTPQRKRADEFCLADLISVLRASPGGLRRWSVMRAMRTLAEKANREVTPKFEGDVERVFRRHCAGDTARGGMAADPASELFYRPKDKAGEVWALNAARAEAW
ncbi:MAG TPA: hypothetical protein VEU47_06735, partial [Candidatus Cybelea sp.]|nr:hypothetical protein [Candidatus Cybelea sp.]